MTTGRLLFVALVLAAHATAALCDGDDKPPAPPPPVAPAPPPPPRECKIEVLAKGEGREAKKDDVVLVQLSIKLAGADKPLMDTRLEGNPQAFPVGSGNLFPALENTLPKMRQGDHWKIDAPWEQAFGERGYGRMVPPRTDLVIDLELVGFVELKIERLKEGSGALPMPGEYVLVHYTGTLEDGKVFDDSRKSDVPLMRVMGDGQVIQGWELTMRKLRVGDRVKSTIPWQLAYGAEGRKGVIPPKANLTFDMERLALPEIKQEVLAEGKGDKCVPGREILVHYTGTLTDGKKFDSSRDRGQPFPVVLGLHRVIPGWELTIAKMRVGDRWKVTIPWLLAYGTQGQGEIPPKSDLVFDIEVLSQK